MLNADKAGEVVFTNLPLGNCRIDVVVPGFSRYSATAVISSGDEVKVAAPLKLGAWVDYVADDFQGDTGPHAEPLPGPTPHILKLEFIAGARLKVTDVSGARVTTSEASVLGVDDEAATHADSEGEIPLRFPMVGDYRVVVRANGFKDKEVSVGIRNSEDLAIGVVLDAKPFEHAIEAVPR